MSYENQQYTTRENQQYTTRQRNINGCHIVFSETRQKQLCTKNKIIYCMILFF